MELGEFSMILEEPCNDVKIDGESISDRSSMSSNDDLKELCRLLNEERQTMYQLTEQWKQTTTTTIERLEQQIVTYQKKLTELEQRQTSLIEENQSLKVQLEKARKKSRTKKTFQTVSTQSESVRKSSIDDPLQQQISVQKMFDAIKTAEVYESLEEFDESERNFLRQFCHFVWNYLEPRSKPKSSCLL